ncbi:MAG: hypothetical protein MZU95_05530 [Desulfomicrobium escambiense]|nr:hypothetical protein [Desulfomicrobium escambiense]
MFAGNEPLFRGTVYPRPLGLGRSATRSSAAASAAGSLHSRAELDQKIREPLRHDNQAGAGVCAAEHTDIVGSFQRIDPQGPCRYRPAGGGAGR